MGGNIYGDLHDQAWISVWRSRDGNHKSIYDGDRSLQMIDLRDGDPMLESLLRFLDLHCRWRSYAEISIGEGYDGESKVSQISFVVSRNTHISLTSGVIEFQSHDITIESASSQVANVESPGFGPIPIRTKRFMDMYGRDQNLFFMDFARAMEKLGVYGVKTGRRGEIRHKCDAIN
ncbi:hypothetical protein LWI29_027736 [Acer saccharum]|uniref:Plant heme peroxidase family profile domain-containing protein n=1 Tax=Acer saccharum TaxID=4024 RepID=A0AA39UWC5_ACESA|nr:hypothetical protein LWI29_027736 [Acer saccharum]